VERRMKNLIIILILLASIQSVNAIEIMPDNKLYPLDTAIERLQLLISITPESDANLNLEFAEERLQEIQTMITENKIGDIESAQENHDANLASLEENMENMDSEDITGLQERLQEHERQIIQLTEAINKEEISVEAKDNMERVISEMSTRTGIASTEAQNEIEEKIALEKGWITDEKLDELLANVNSWGRVQSNIGDYEGGTAKVRLQEDGADTQVFSFKVSEGTIIRCDCDSSNVVKIDINDVQEIVAAIDDKRPTRLMDIAVAKYGVTKEQIEEVLN
jgi:hypothetical protein